MSGSVGRRSGGIWALGFLLLTGASRCGNSGRDGGRRKREGIRVQLLVESGEQGKKSGVWVYSRPADKIEKGKEKSRGSIIKIIIILIQCWNLFSFLLSSSLLSVSVPFLPSSPATSNPSLCPTPVTYRCFTCHNACWSVIFSCFIK